MKHFAFLLLAGMLCVSPGISQTENDISIPEFRMAIFDLAGMVDAQKGTNFVVQMQNVPDETYAKLYRGVPNGRRFRSAVAGLKARREGRLPASPLRPRLMAMSRTDAPQPAYSSPPPLAGITSVGAPDFTLFTPGYPNPGTDSHWSAMAGALQGIGALPSGDVSSTHCDADTKVLNSVILSTFKGIKDAADNVCEIIPDPLVVVLGEGTAVPLKEICYGITLVLSVFNSTIEGLVGDCEEQDDLVTGAEIEAAYFNTVALGNLKLRLKIEQNLQNTTAPIALFELPSFVGGYLEVARAIVADAISKLSASGVNTTTAASALAQGDVSFNARSWKAAYQKYQTAYGLATK